MSSALPLKEAASQLGVTANTLRRQISNGRLNASELQIGGVRIWVVEQPEIDRYRVEVLGKTGRKSKS